MEDLLTEKMMFNIALGATVLIWTMIGIAYCTLILGKRLAR